MTPTPIVAVTADVKDIDGYRWHAAAETYLKAVVVGLAGIPLIVPSLGAGIDFERFSTGSTACFSPAAAPTSIRRATGETPSPRPNPTTRPAMPRRCP